MGGGRGGWGGGARGKVTSYGPAGPRSAIGRASDS